MSESSNLGPWCRLRVLGRGGFGLVTLWRNQITDKHIAIKCLRENELQGVIKPKHRERWCKEVEIMQKLKHKNIVSALDIPESFASVQSTVPLLAMEYCKLGDLRQVLVKPENSCGLKESMIFDILRDVASGLNYLHSCKVIHRDIKPDNIVLQADGDKIVYKLIDLGYAKELDQSSLCESFVGTIQYLAPELFLGHQYTCSVDYWSFGLVAHEIITGHRPFLPGQSPAVWMKEIQNKKRSIISVIQTCSGETIHSSSLSKVNHLSSCLRDDFVKWLQLALDWNGKTRGRDVETNALNFFTLLNKILDKQIVRIFSLPTVETLSYIVNKDTNVSNLQNWIYRDIGLEVDDQILLLAGGKTLSPKANLLGSLPSLQTSSEEIVLFLFTSGVIKIQSKPVIRPLFVRELLDDPKRMLEYPLLKRTSSDAVFVVQTEAALYKNILAAIAAKVESISQKTAAVENLLEDVDDEWLQVEAFSQFYFLSHKSDLECYVELRKAGHLANNDLIKKWIQKAGELENKLSELRGSRNKNQQRQEVATAKMNAHELVNHPMSTKSILDELLAECLILYDKIQKIPRDVRGHPLSNTDMVRILLKDTEASAKLLRSPIMTERFMRIFESEDHLAKLISPLTMNMKTCKIMRQMIETGQRERQREIWELAKTLKNSEPKTKSPEKLKIQPVNGQFSPFHIPKTVHHEPVSPLDENMLRVNFQISGPVSVSPTIGVAPFSVDLPKADEIIQSNCEWRYRTLDLTESCHQTMQEIRSLNWDFLNES